jgi:hypothetical protein
MKIVPIVAKPNQTQQIVLDGQNCSIEISSHDGYTYTDGISLVTAQSYLSFTLLLNGVEITTNALVLNLKRVLINRQYLGFVGDFMFVDTQGVLDPQYTGLGTRWVLVYLEASDL